MGIIAIVAGAVWFILSFAMDPSSAPQQTIQYLGFVCGSIFIIGGLLFLRLNKIIIKKEEQNSQLKNIVEILNRNNYIHWDTKKCPLCAEEIKKRS